MNIESLLYLHKSWLNCEKNGMKVRLCRDDLKGADLRGVNLSEANLIETDLSGADLRGANLSGADLTGANLSKAKLGKANLNRADLTRANLSWANLGGACLRGAHLRYVNLTGANLTEADLTEVHVYRIIGKNIFTFQLNIHSGIFVDGVLTIGCRSMTPKMWLKKGLIIARQNEYTDNDISQYKSMIQYIIDTMT